MANLETLELTINANAQSASEGLQSLRSSLSSLSRAITSTYKKMIQLNSELEKLKALSDTKLPTIGQNVATSTSKRLSGYGNATQRVQEQSQAIAKNMESVSNATSKTASSMREYSNTASNTGNKSKDFVQGMKDLGKSVKEMLPKFNLLNRVLRVASTMLIRMGVKALFKGAKEGFDNFYQYASATGNAFASQMDKVYSSWGQIKNQLGASLASVFTAALPAINALASAAITAFNYVSQLIALLTGKGSWSRATEQALSYADAINKANKGKGGGGGMKELLADFDELNVITSEGGGGGGAAATAQAYEDMFEEVTQFDDKIRQIADFIKDTIQFVKDNFEELVTIAGLIGLAILGWKISDAFDGALSTLGRIIAGGALLTLGVALEFSFGQAVGRSLVTGQALSWYDILKGIAGVVAAGIGGYLVFGGAAGVGVGVAIALSVFLAGVIVGWKDEKDKLKWGDKTLSPEQVEKLVKSQFTFDVDAEINIMNAKVQNSMLAKMKLAAEIYKFSENLSKIKIGVEVDPNAINDAKTSMDTIIADLKTYTEESEVLLTAYLQFMPYGNSEKEGITADITSANSQLNEYFKIQGEKAAELYDQGMKDGWSKNEQKMIIDLMEHVHNIFNGADMNKATHEAVASSITNLSELTKKSAQDVLDKQKEILENHKKAMGDSAQQIYSDLMYYADLAYGAGLVDEETGRALGDVYAERAEQILDEFETQYELKLEDTKAAMKESWINSLKNVYGEDALGVVANWAGDNYARFNKELKKSYKRGEKDARETIKEYLGYMEKEFFDADPIMKQAADMFGISGWEIFSDEAKSVFVHSIYESVGVQGVALLKQSLNISASEIMKITNWKSFSNQQKIEFIQAIVDAYGSTEALNAAKKAGIDIQQTITDAISEGGKAKEAADKLMAVINEEAKKNKVNVDANVTVTVDVIAQITAVVKNGVVNSVNAIANAAQAVIQKHADGAYGIPCGDLFIANEQGAELVGSIGGKTSVANQEQIIEGIQRGVSEANSEQNVLLRQQNDLLRRILEKEFNVNFGASAGFGRTVKRSIDMYNGMVGG